MTPLERLIQLRTEAEARQRAATAQITLQISVGMATCGMSAGAEAVWQALARKSRQAGVTISPRTRRLYRAMPCRAVDGSGGARGMPALYGDVTPEYCARDLPSASRRKPPLEKHLVDGGRNVIASCTRRWRRSRRVPASPCEHPRSLDHGLRASRRRHISLSKPTACATLPRPILIVAPGDSAYHLPTAGMPQRIVEQHLRDGQPVQTY